MSERRYQHILQPIRDLTATLNIDLAQELEEYLEELETLPVSLPRELDDDGVQERILNFAEAALLIQGSSTIYGRKVQYFHDLVYQALEHLSSSKQRKKAKNADGSDGHEVLETEEEDLEEDEKILADPLPLYDEIEEASSTSLIIKERPVESASRQKEDARQRLKHRSRIQASIALSSSLAPDGRDHGDSFRLQSCKLHPSGVLLLDDASRQYLDPSQVARESNLIHSDRDGSLEPLGMDISGFNTGENDEGSYDTNDAAEVLDWDIAYQEQQDTAALEAPTRVDETLAMVANADENGSTEAYDDYVHPTTDTDEPMEAYTYDDQPDTFPDEPEEVYDDEPVDEYDPWAPLDPYDTSSCKSKPLKKGNTYMPALIKKQKQRQADKDHTLDSISDPAFHQRFFSSDKNSSKSLGGWVYSDLHHKVPFEKRFRKCFCKSKVLATSCPKLWKSQKEYQTLYKKVQKTSQPDAFDEFEEEEALPTTTSAEPMDLTQPPPVSYNPETPDDEDLAMDDPSIDDSIDDSTPLDGASDEPSAELPASRMSSYSELYSDHFRSYVADVDDFVQDSELAKSVQTWQTSVAPMLERQKRLPQFDIRTTGEELLTNLGRKVRTKVSDKENPVESDDIKKEVEFKELMRGKSRYEVARCFLASLQLANSGNVGLFPPEKRKEGHGGLKVQLLNPSLQHFSIE